MLQLPISNRMQIVLLVSVLLTGCDQASQMAQQAASSATAIVSEEIKKQSDGAIEQMTGEAKEVLQPLGIDANQIASSVKSKSVELAKNILKTDSSWAELEQFKGQLPQDIGLFTPLSPIASELKAILQDDYPAFISQMKQAAPLQSDGVLYVLSKPDAKGGKAWLLIDSKNRKLEAGLIRDKAQKTFNSQGEAITRPAAVQQFIQ